MKEETPLNYPIAHSSVAALVGALEVPGGILGTTVRLNRPAQNRQASVKPGPDGFMEQPINPTARERSLTAALRWHERKK